MNGDGDDNEKTESAADEELVPVNDGTMTEEGEGDDDDETDGEGGEITKPGDAIENSGSGE